MNSGILGKMFAWGKSASYSDTTVSVWMYGLALVLVLSFLWSTVVRQVLRDVAAEV